MNINFLKTQYHNLSLSFQFNSEYLKKCQEIKNILGWQRFCFDSGSKTWVFDIDDLELVMKILPIAVIDEKVREALLKYNKNKETEKVLKQISVKPIEVKGLPLFEYQKKGVGFASTYKRVFIADEMGLGKTIQVLGVIKHLKLNIVLIVCPASLKSNWAMEIEKWNITGSQIYITNYEMLSKVVLPNNIDLLVFDECHYLKNSKAKRTKFAKEATKRADRIIMLTGTPILNRPQELVSQLEVLDKIKDFGGQWKFLMRYCDAKQDRWGHWDFSGASNLGELRLKLNDFTLRRTKQEVLKDLPEKLVHYTYLDMPEPLEYKRVKSGIYDDLQKNKEAYKEFYEVLGGMSEIDQAQYLDGLSQNEKYKSLSASILKSIEKLKQESVRQKLNLIPQILEDYKVNWRKCVVFTTHKMIVEELVKMFPESVGIHGDVEVDKRQELVNKFQTDSNVLFFFGTIKTAGVGFTLTAASEVIFLELDWTPTLHQQAEDRCYRIGQKNNVNVNYLVLKDSIDEDIVKILLNKSEVIEGAIKGKVLSKILKNLFKTD